MAVAGCLRGASHHIVSGVSFLQADKQETEVTVRHVYWRTEEMPTNAFIADKICLLLSFCQWCYRLQILGWKKL